MWRLVPPSVFRASVYSVASDIAPLPDGSTRHRLAYALGGQTCEIYLAGNPPVVLAGSDWRPAGYGLLSAVVSVGLAAFAACLLRFAYESQHSWYLRYGHGTTIVFFGLLGALAIARAAYGARLAPFAWTLETFWAPALVPVTLALAASIACHVGDPSAVHALGSLQSGNTEAAAMEAGALVECQIDQTGGEVILDAVHMRKVRAQSSVVPMVASLRDNWYSPTNQAAAIRVLLERAPAEASASYATDDLDSLGRVQRAVSPFDLGLSASFQALGHLVAARIAGSQTDWAGATSELAAASTANPAEITRTRNSVADAARQELQRLSSNAIPVGDARARLSQLQAMVAAAKCATTLSGQPTQPAVQELQAAMAPVQQQVAQLDKREAALAEARRRQDEAAEKQRQAQEAGAQRIRDAQEHEANRMVLCADGTSSGCSCNGSHRGCCSHHGGIAGCTP